MHKRSMMVHDFIISSVPEQYIEAFKVEMCKWDEPASLSRFYTVDVLDMLLRQAREHAEQQPEENMEKRSRKCNKCTRSFEACVWKDIDEEKIVTCAYCGWPHLVKDEGQLPTREGHYEYEGYIPGGEHMTGIVQVTIHPVTNKKLGCALLPPGTVKNRTRNHAEVVFGELKEFKGKWGDRLHLPNFIKKLRKEKNSE